MVKPVNIKALENGTSISWSDWCTHLDAQNAKTLSHNEIVKIARAFRPISGWWAQGVAVAYEQKMGLRLPGQTSDGLFSASITRTIDGRPSVTHASWCAFANDQSDFAGVRPSVAPTTSETPKRLYWRCKFEDGSAVSMSLEPKAGDKTLVVVEHRKLLAASEIDMKKEMWSGLLRDCFSKP